MEIVLVVDQRDIHIVFSRQRLFQRKRQMQTAEAAAENDDALTIVRHHFVSINCRPLIPAGRFDSLAPGESADQAQLR